MMQLAMKKMVGTWYDDDGQVLWPRPVKYIGKWDGVILFTMNDNGVDRDGRHGPFAGGRADEGEGQGQSCGDAQSGVEVGRIHERRWMYLRLKGRFG